MGLERLQGDLVVNFDQKNPHLVTFALVSPTRNRWSRAQTSIFTIDNQHFLVQMAPQASWPRDVPAESLKPGVLSHRSFQQGPQSGVSPSRASSARRIQRRVFSQQSPARSFQPRYLRRESSAKIPQSGILSQKFSARVRQESSARNPQPRSLSQEFSARNPQPGSLSR